MPRVVHTARVVPFPSTEEPTPLAPVIHIGTAGSGSRPPTYPHRGSSLVTDDELMSDEWGPGAVPSDPVERARHDALRAAIDHDLWAWGVSGRDRLFERFELAELALAIAEVQAQRRAGTHVRNPAGLFIYWLQERTGRKAFG
jgi:hypothetical protein